MIRKINATFGEGTRRLERRLEALEEIVTSSSSELEKLNDRIRVLERNVSFLLGTLDD
jgi:prefoldin subunit 5